MIKPRRLLPLLLVAACGDDGGSPPDATPPDAEIPVDPDAMVPACTELDAPAGTITSYPGSFSGTVVGAGADLRVGEGVCTVEESWFDQIGEDTVIALTGLTPGTEYGVILDAEDDLGFYVITGCDEDARGPAAGQCQVFDDSSTTGEVNRFTPTAADAFVVVDTANLGGPPVTGDFALRVLAIECETSGECADPTPVCSDFDCVECGTDFDCGSTTPICDVTTCVAGPSQCTGDDPGDDGGGDDGPGAARPLATPTSVNSPTTATAAVCNAPGDEEDWYTFTVSSANTYGFELSFVDAVDLDLYLLDATGGVIVHASADGQVPEAFVYGLGPGTYYLVATMASPADLAAASAYTLTLRRAECDSSFGCTSDTEPVCTASGVCVAGPNDCTGDDEGDTTGAGDDGPAAARSLDGAVDEPVVLASAVCSAGAGESDYYQVTVGQGEGVVLDLAWDNAGADLDIYVQRDDGVLLGYDWWLRPSQVTLTYLPAGTYYVQVALYAPGGAVVAEPYTITATKTAAQTCTGAADCAAAYSTQLYRGACTSGVCDFIPGGGAAAGAACDSWDDCGSGMCSYIAFEADAHESVCTDTCTTTADCAAIGTGLTCTNGAFGMCVPSCAANIDCGATPNGGLVEPGTPWHYYTCTVDTGVCTL